MRPSYIIIWKQVWKEYTDITFSMLKFYLCIILSIWGKLIGINKMGCAQVILLEILSVFESPRFSNQRCTIFSIDYLFNTAALFDPSMQLPNFEPVIHFFT